MKSPSRTRSCGAAVAALAALAFPSGAAANAGPVVFTPATLVWAAGTGADAGAKIAVLEGNPERKGPYTMRLKLPAGARFMPHAHPDTERVTVISGTMLVGMGDAFTIPTMTLLPAGSYVVIPRGRHHYAMAQGATEIQITGNGPSSTVMVKPK